MIIAKSIGNIKNNYKLCRHKQVFQPDGDKVKISKGNWKSARLADYNENAGYGGKC